MDTSGWRIASVVWLAMVAAGGVMTAQAGAKGNPAAAKMANPIAVSPESVAAGEKLYKQHCQFCHGPDAKGMPPAGDSGKPAPDLTDVTWDHGSSDGEIFDSIKNGVRPDLYMEPWGDRLSDADIWNLVNYTRSLGKH
jgi:mono/diheme cytochrome c family protein